MKEEEKGQGKGWFSLSDPTGPHEPQGMREGGNLY